MSKSNVSEIKFIVELDDNRIPENYLGQPKMVELRRRKLKL
jgi:hypothetical protein